MYLHVPFLSYLVMLLRREKTKTKQQSSLSARVTPTSLQHTKPSQFTPSETLTLGDAGHGIIGSGNSKQTFLTHPSQILTLGDTGHCCSVFWRPYTQQIGSGLGRLWGRCSERCGGGQQRHAKQQAHVNEGHGQVEGRMEQRYSPCFFFLWFHWPPSSPTQS